MKFSEMNERQKKAFINIKHASNWLLGGLENTITDYSKDTEEYKEAKALLGDHEALVNELYEMATTNLYDEGMECFNASATKWIKDIRFCGKEWLMERCEKRITKEGY